MSNDTGDVNGIPTWTYRVEAISTEYAGDESSTWVSIKGAYAIQMALTDLGDQGWELVAFLPVNLFSTVPTFHAIFKKPESSEDAYTRRQFKRRGTGKLPK